MSSWSVEVLHYVGSESEVHRVGESMSWLSYHKKKCWILCTDSYFSTSDSFGSLGRNISNIQESSIRLGWQTIKSLIHRVIGTWANGPRLAAEQKDGRFWCRLTVWESDLLFSMLVPSSNHTACLKMRSDTSSYTPFLPAIHSHLHFS